MNYDPKEIQAFINDLQALSEKHNIWLNSCGCCSSIQILSPRWNKWLSDPREGELRYRSSGDECLTATNWHGRENQTVRWMRDPIIAKRKAP